ncbi:MAG: SCP2 sterol-binding domain-containing protein [Gemmatimonadaceae bacterium]|jgi:putative sterol carrier protein|nr:SCP2 sterol-binding domain-containing protein [Gemmatimonadaceae bacterium]
MHDAFSPAWAAAWRDAIDTDAGYAAAANGWRDAIALVCTPDGAAGFAVGAAVQVALDAGRCTAADARAVDAVDAPFVLQATAATWRDLVDGRLDPVAGVMFGRLVPVAGSLGTIMTHAAGLKALVACARRVPTRWPA